MYGVRRSDKEIKKVRRRYSEEVGGVRRREKEFRGFRGS